MNNVKTVKTQTSKYKKVITGVFVFLCVVRVLMWIFSGAGSLPGCKDHKITTDMLPKIMRDVIAQVAPAGYLGKDITISSVEELMYDKKAGIRQCQAVGTFRTDDDVETDDVYYQIAWTNENKGEYQVKILHGE